MVGRLRGSNSRYIWESLTQETGGLELCKGLPGASVLATQKLLSMGTFTKPLAAGGPGRAGGEEEERLVMCSVTTVGLGWKLFLIYSPLVQTFY